MTVRGGIGSSIVLGAGLVTSRVPASAWPNHVPVVANLRHDPGAHRAFFVLLFLGIAVLISAWLTLGDRVRSGLADVNAVYLVTAAWAVPVMLAPPLFSGDGWSYVADGYLTGHGLSPYVFTPSVLDGPVVQAVNGRWMHTTTPYGPVPLLWGGLVSHATADPWLLMLAHRALALLGLALLAFAAPRLARYAGHDPAVATWLVVATPFVLLHGVGGLHNDLLVAGLIACALLATIRHGWLAGSVLAGVAAAVKIPGGFVCVGVVLLALPIGANLGLRLRRTAQVGGVAGAVLVGIGVLGELGIGWTRSLSVPVGTGSVLAVTTDLGRLAGRFAPDAPWPAAGPVALAHAAGLVVIAACAALALVRAPAGDRARALEAVALVMLAVTVLSPAGHYWYALWCLPLLAMAPRSPRATATVIAAALALALTAPLDPSLHLHGQNALLLLATVAAGVIVWLKPNLYRSAGSPDTGARTVAGRP
ncbi:polyprenol phosphomannose-dependent alpha 1,6 mannosyltransferase MptB [Marmoricola sp. RAF53]|uniref:polyprenol phosphomannose-dependent alpha 1,6 mannosyltransferase MptB n=1 Tax=Marmoricola sp. RAF53 TaxID=3233059 RepID=UPI003F9C9E00